MSGFTRTIIAAAMAAAVCSAPAAAATYDFELTGSVSNGTTSSFDAGGSHYTIFEILLDGFSDPFDLQVGDVLNLRVTLEELVNVPASNFITFLGVDADTNVSIFASDPLADVSFSYLSPLDGDYAGEEYYGACTNCLSATMSLSPGPAFQISDFLATITVENLTRLDSSDTSPVTLNGFTFRYQATDTLAAAVPEPATWATMLLGFALIGTASRRRRGVRQIAA